MKDEEDYPASPSLRGAGWQTTRPRDHETPVLPRRGASSFIHFICDLVKYFGSGFISLRGSVWRHPRLPAVWRGLPRFAAVWLT